MNVTNLGWWVYWVIGTNLYLIDQVELFQPALSKVKIVGTQLSFRGLYWLVLGSRFFQPLETFAVNDEENAAKQTNNACAFDTQAMENKRC